MHFQGLEGANSSSHRNSMIPEVFPMIQSSNDSFLQLERWVKKLHCFEGWPCYWDEFVWPGFRRWKYAYPCLASSTNTWRAWARYLLQMNCILLLHIQICTYGVYVYLVRSMLPWAWGDCQYFGMCIFCGFSGGASSLTIQGYFFVFLAWIPGLQTARVLSRQLTIAEPKWQRAFGHQHYNFASSSFYAARFFASSQLLVSSYSFARCLVRRRGTIKFHDFQCFVRQQWYVSIRFYQPWWTTERSLKP